MSELFGIKSTKAFDILIAKVTIYISTNIKQNPFTQAINIFWYFAFSSATVEIDILIPTYTNTNNVNPTAKFLIALYQITIFWVSFPFNFSVSFTFPKKSILNISYFPANKSCIVNSTALELSTCWEFTIDFKRALIKVGTIFISLASALAVAPPILGSGDTLCLDFPASELAVVLPSFIRLSAESSSTPLITSLMLSFLGSAA